MGGSPFVKPCRQLVNSHNKFGKKIPTIVKCTTNNPMRTYILQLIHKGIVTFRNERPVPTKKPIIVKRKSPLYTETHIYGQKPIVIRKKSPITHKQKTLSPTKYSPSRYSKLDTSHYVNQTSPRYVKPTSPRMVDQSPLVMLNQRPPGYGRSKVPSLC